MVEGKHRRGGEVHGRHQEHLNQNPGDMNSAWSKVDSIMSRQLKRDIDLERMVIIQDAVDSDIEEAESLLAIGSPVIRKEIDTSFGSGDYIFSPCHTNLSPMLVVARH